MSSPRYGLHVCIQYSTGGLTIALYRGTINPLSSCVIFIRIIPRSWLPWEAAMLHCSETFMLAFIDTVKIFALLHFFLSLGMVIASLYLMLARVARSFSQVVLGLPLGLVPCWEWCHLSLLGDPGKPAVHPGLVGGNTFLPGDSVQEYTSIFYVFLFGTPLSMHCIVDVRGLPLCLFTFRYVALFVVVFTSCLIHAQTIWIVLSAWSRGLRWSCICFILYTCWHCVSFLSLLLPLQISALGSASLQQ